MCLEVFTATKLSKVFSERQSRKEVYKFRHFADQLHIYHLTALMIQLVSEMSELINLLTRFLPEKTF